MTEAEPARRGTAETIFHKLARIFNSLHWMFGITTLPANATPLEVRSFVFLGLGFIVFMIVFFAVFLYWLGTF